MLLTFPERAKQRRWTVFLRGILTIPLAVVVLVYAIGTFFVVIIAWFGALFTGRMPDFARVFVLKFLKKALNLLTYGHLLTDTFPPFDADPSGYLTHMAAPPATTLNRWAVFFRFILVIPAYIVASVVAYGLGIVLIVLWLITLITGWLPTSAHNAIAAFIRYQTRYSAYWLLVVPTYPGGLFGDGEAQAGTETAGPVSAARPPSSGVDAWKLSLNRGARRLLVVFIVVGALGYIAQVSIQAAVSNHNDDQTATLNASVDALTTSFAEYKTSVENCASDHAQVACLERAAATLSSQLRTFANSVQGLDVNGVPPSAIAAAVTSAKANALGFDQLAQAGPTATGYADVAQHVNLDNELNQLQADLNALTTQ